MRIRSKLDQILKEKHITRAELHRRTGLHKRVLRRFYMDDWRQISRSSLEAICNALEITRIGDLMELYDENIFYPILTQRTVTIYLGAQADAQSNGAAHLAKLSQSIWDTRAAFYISDYLRKKSTDIDVQFEIIISRPTDRINYDALRDIMKRITSGGNHIVIGSPASNILAEYVLCSFYKARPLTPEDQAKIPYRFAWPDALDFGSTLGKYADKKRKQHLDAGIYGERRGKVIAVNKFATVGEGADCGIIAVKRHKRERHAHGPEEGLVMVLAGYSGTATLGAARIAVEKPGEIFPGNLDEPLMRVISVKYTKLSKGNFDDRILDDVCFVT